MLETMSAKMSSEATEGNGEAAKMMEAVKDLSLRLSKSKPLYLQSAMQSNLLGRNSKRKRDSSVDYEIHNTPTKAAIVAKERSPFDLNWDLFKRWPEGVREEEVAVSEYFKRLKIFHLEQETKNLFIMGTSDDKQIIYTPAQVQELEAEVQELKTSLKERKKLVGSVRKQIEALADELSEFDTVQKSIQQAEELSSGIAELEWELETLRASGVGRRAGGSKTAPMRGTVTREEAEEMLNRQLESMETLESEHSSTMRATELAKKQLAEGLQSLNRLEVEHKAAERQAREAQRTERDLKVEAICKAHKATSSFLCSLLGISSIAAPTPTCLRSVYRVQDKEARRVCSEVAVLIHFTHPGGRIKAYELQSMTGQALTSQLAPPHSASRAHLDRALDANDASLLVQEILVCIESARWEG